MVRITKAESILEIIEVLKCQRGVVLQYQLKQTSPSHTLRIAILTRVACVVVLVMDRPLKSELRVFVLMAVLNLDRMALELELFKKTNW
jgi:hypothetical protein